MSLNLKQDIMNAVKDSNYQRFDAMLDRQLEQEYRDRRRMQGSTAKTVDGIERMEIWLDSDDYEKLRDIRAVMGFGFDEIYSLALDEYYKSHGIGEAMRNIRGC